MRTLTSEGLVRRSAAVLFLSAGLITIVNELVVWPPETRPLAVIVCSLVSLLSGVVVIVGFRRGFPLRVRVGIALWGLALLLATAGIGNTVGSSTAPMAAPIFLMVIVVWLGLTSGRGIATAFAPVMIAACALLASLPDSRIIFSDAALVVVVSMMVAETIAWAMHELERRGQQLTELAMTDPLTGLLNRTAFSEQLDAACRNDERVILAFADLNGFKDVNDTFGHQVGDAVLVEVGARLRDLARTRDLVGRFGGDEFVVLFRDIPPGVQSESLVARIQTTLDAPWPELGATTITASIGVVDSQDGVAEPEELMCAADTAMYMRKHGTEPTESPNLRNSRALAQHRAAMDGLGGGFCVLQHLAGQNDWMIVEANRRVRDAYEPVCGDPVGLLLSEVNRYADNSSVSNLYGAALATGQRAETELELRIPGEAPGWRRLFAIPIGPATVAALTWDITREHDAREALKDAVEHSTAVVESAADAILTIDADGLIAGFNRAAEAAFAIGRAEAIGQHYSGFVPPTSLPALREAFALGADARVETSLRRADDITFLAEVALSGVETSHGKLYTAIVRDVTEQRTAAEALRTALECDDLTGRPNLHSLLIQADEAAQRAVTAGHSIGLLFIDLDRFTLVNDTLGHDLGDVLLIDVADRIARVVREGDVVARISGDHFLVLCEQVDVDDVLVSLATRIHEVLRDPFPLGDRREVFVTASIGAALWQSHDAPRDLVRFAHTAMQQARQLGPSGVQVFSGDMAIVSATRLEAETALRRALDRDELIAHYQPIVDLETGATAGMEALVRWEQPGVGLVAPSEFIGLAEQTGLIVPLGTWMLRRALTDCSDWQALAPGIGVSINVSALQFRLGDFVATVRGFLAELALAPHLVTLEITESIMLEHSAWNLAVLEQLRSLGLKLALDDFGTGYSAITHLRRLPISTIKMDRSFLDGINAEDCQATVRAIVELARVHRIDVVAEGIETETARELVRSAGCHRGQGYLFGRPQPLEILLSSIADARSAATA
ncbi:MAG: diguanylate cyclase [Acidimicrobiia bacterium]|nr:diguanylate cyclase [Acidimicrobiia bacterium]